jgi:hypothetical protein
LNLEELKAEVRRRLAERRPLQPPDPPPRYDDVFWEGLAQLNTTSG